MIWCQQFGTLIGLAVGFGFLALVTWAAKHTPCDSAFWEGFRTPLGIARCR